MKTNITLTIGSEKHIFELEIRDVYNNGCRFTVSSTKNEGILFGGYISNGVYGTDIIRREVFFFQDWLNKKVKTGLRKLNIKFRCYD